MPPKTTEEWVEEFFTEEDEYGYSIDTAASGGDLNNKEYTRGILTPKLHTLITTLRKETEEAVAEALREAISKIEIARQEHNEARHGDSTDDAYDRACDAINPDLTPPDTK